VKLQSIRETEDEIRHRAIQAALLSFLMNLFSASISSSTLGTVFKLCIFFRMMWGMGILILECQCSLRCKLEVGAEHK
jgi:hypothetical protein